MNERTKLQVPEWLGGESGQRKRYLRSLEQDLAAQLGPDWRDKLKAQSKAAS